MIEIGSTIEAVVTRVEPYGIFLRRGEEEVVVLLPEFSWRRVKNLREVVHIGDHLTVVVLRYNYKDRKVVASVRRLHQEENPYRELSRLPAGATLEGTVTLIAGDHLTVELPNGAWGSLPRLALPNEAHVGQKLKLEVESLDVDEGRLALMPAGCPVEATP